MNKKLFNYFNFNLKRRRQKQITTKFPLFACLLVIYLYIFVEVSWCCCKTKHFLVCRATWFHWCGHSFCWGSSFFVAGRSYFYPPPQKKNQHKIKKKKFSFLFFLRVFFITTRKNNIRACIQFKNRYLYIFISCTHLL